MTEANRQARKPDSSCKTPGERGQGDQARSIGSFPKRQQPHPWKQQQQGSMVECGQIQAGDVPPSRQSPTHGEGSHFNIGEDGLAQPTRTTRRFLKRAHRPGSTCSGPVMDYVIKHDPDGFNPRFDGSSRVVHHVKDGRPLTERGAELLKERG